MCIIVYKPKDIKFPTKETLKQCFIKNPDGAGFMYPSQGSVQIHKGFASFKSFYKALAKARQDNGDDIPYVLHFRISTQAHGRMDCTHPFPLSSHMNDLRKLYTKSNIGIAHNGIISLTSTFGYSKTITWSDTMQFITDYLSLIIKDKNYYKDKNTLLLIERLCESKLAIMDGDGHVELIGSGFIQDDGVYYSNTSYKPYKPISTTYTYKPSQKQYVYTAGQKPSTTKVDSIKSTLASINKENDDDDDDWFNQFEKKNYDPWQDFFNPATGKYDFSSLDCPCSYDHDYYDGLEYCDKCSNFNRCYGATNDEDDD